MFSSDLRYRSLTVAALFLAGCGGEAQRKTEAPGAPVSVETVTVQQVEWPSTYEAIGTVRARTASVISSKAMGYVREVRFQTGDRVQAGQLLVSLDARDLDAQRRQANAALEEARNGMAEVQNAIAAAKANLDLTQVTFRRMKDLFDKKSISNQEFDEAGAKLKVAQASYEMAVARRSQLGSRIQQAEEAVRAAEVARSYAEIKAPFAGVVTEKRVEPGSLATPGAPLATVEQAGAYRLEVPVEESRVGSIRSGHAVTVTLEALNRTLPARVSEVVPAVDAASRSFVVKIDLPGLAELRSGLFGRAEFPMGARRALAVPSAAVIEQGQIRSVMVAEGGVAHHRLLTLGSKLKDQVEVLSGLSEGERVISPFPAGISDGARVEVRK